MKVKRFNEFEKVNESSIDYDMLDQLKSFSAYDDLVRGFVEAVEKFENAVENSDLGYDSGDNDHYLAFKAALSEAMHETY